MHERYMRTDRADCNGSAKRYRCCAEADASCRFAMRIAVGAVYGPPCGQGTMV